MMHPHRVHQSKYGCHVCTASKRHQMASSSDMKVLIDDRIVVMNCPAEKAICGEVELMDQCCCEEIWTWRDDQKDS